MRNQIHPFQERSYTREPALVDSMSFSQITPPPVQRKFGVAQVGRPWDTMHLRLEMVCQEIIPFVLRISHPWQVKVQWNEELFLINPNPLATLIYSSKQRYSTSIEKREDWAEISKKSVFFSQQHLPSQSW